MLVAVGLNQKCASVSEREVLASAGAEILAGYGGLDGVDEVMVLSTCNGWRRVVRFSACRL